MVGTLLRQFHREQPNQFVQQNRRNDNNKVLPIRKKSIVPRAQISLFQLLRIFDNKLSSPCIADVAIRLNLFLVNFLSFFRNPALVYSIRIVTQYCKSIGVMFSCHRNLRYYWIPYKFSCPCLKKRSISLHIVFNSLSWHLNKRYDRFMVATYFLHYSTLINRV